MLEQEQPPTPTINMQVGPDSATLTFLLGNGLSIRQEFTAETMQQMCKVWLESRKELMKQQQIVADVLKTKR